MTGTKVRLVKNSEDWPEYPISHKDRLDSHFFLQWNLKRWRGSEFRKKAYSDPEVGWYGFELFCLSQDETPVGTLPCDHSQLAFVLHLPLEKWLALTKRDLSPLHGWEKVMCDNGELRFAHPVVTEIAVEALGSKRRNTAKNAEDRMRKRISSISQTLSKNIPGGGGIAKNDERLNQISDWIEKFYPGGSATVKRIQEAWEALSKR